MKRIESRDRCGRLLTQSVVVQRGSVGGRAAVFVRFVQTHAQIVVFQRRVHLVPLTADVRFQSAGPPDETAAAHPDDGTQRSVRPPISSKANVCASRKPACRVRCFVSAIRTTSTFDAVIKLITPLLDWGKRKKKKRRKITKTTVIIKTTRAK